MAQPPANAQEILAKGIARAKELAAKLAKNAPPSSTSTTQKRPLESDSSSYDPYHRSSQSGFVSQQDAFGSYKRQAGIGSGGYPSAQAYGARGIDEMMIPATMVGLIIGRGGETLKSIQSQAGNVRIQIDKENTGAQRRVNFTGTRESIDEAKRLISEKIGDQQQPPSQQQQYQQSSNGATAAGGPAVGNYGPTEESERLIIPANKVGLVIGTKGATLRDLQEQSGARIQIDRDHQVTNPNERQVAIYGNAEQISQAKTLLDQLINGGGSSVRPSSASLLPTMIINVPGDMVGLVIGRGGETIKNIQQMSGCNVKIDQNNGAAIRTITVTGQPDNLRYAEEMIQEKVQGSGQIVSGGPADASQAVGMSAAGYDASAAAYYGQQVPQASAADYSAYYDQTASAASSAQAYADYYAQYYSQQQPPVSSATAASAAVEEENGREGEKKNAENEEEEKQPQRPSDEALQKTIKEAAAAAAAAAGASDPATLAYYQQYYEQYYTSYYAQQQQQQQSSSAESVREEDAKVNEQADDDNSDNQEQ